MRIGGLGGMILPKLGVIPQQIATGDIYPVARARDDRRRRMDRAVRRREARPAQGRQVLLLPRLVGRQRAEHAARQSQRRGRRCRRPVQDGVRNGLRRDRRADDGEIRREQSGSAEAPGRRRHAGSRSSRGRCWMRAYKAAFQTFEELSAKSADFKQLYEAWTKFITENESLVPRCREHARQLPLQPADPAALAGAIDNRRPGEAT